ncbi:MAG: L,D-transpeptidase family protein [Verrucomicrobiota bacterium]|nr:L,D-transpeptidase family protein [Verrucomicrobiota bacterium]
MFMFRSAVALSVLALFVSCAEIETPPTTNAPAPTPIPGFWNGDGVPGSPKIVVDITRQRAYFFKGKQLVGESTVSTGKKGFSTPPGTYQVLSKDKDHVSTVFGDYVDDFGNVVKSNIDSRKDSRPPGSHYDGARMPYAMFFRGGYAMHQGYVPPYAASHGCIRVPQGMANIFFDNAPVGTPVVVKESPAETYSRVEPDQGPPLAPVPLTAPPPGPALVRSTAPASVRPASVRSTVPAPTPVPVRSPAAVLSRAPAPARSPAPAAVVTPSPTPSPTPAHTRRRRGPKKTPR